jgi:hypothetical protein
MGVAIGKPFHLKQWLSVQQTVDHLSAVVEEPLTSADLADLAEDHQLDLYWYRPGQMLAYADRNAYPHRNQTRELNQPLRLCPDNHSDWHALVGILRDHPALPAGENDTPLLVDAEGNRLTITFDSQYRPEPYSSRWYPSLAELMLKRSDLDRLESQLFSAPISAQGSDLQLRPDLLLDVIWQLEQLALDDGGGHDIRWLKDQLTARNHNLDSAALEQVLVAAERQGGRGLAH